MLDTPHHASSSFLCKFPTTKVRCLINVTLKDKVCFIDISQALSIVK